MKKLLLLTFALTPLIQSADAFGRIVYDRRLTSVTRANHVKEIAQFLEMVTNQVTQINTLKSQLDQVTTYVDRFGNPEALQDIVGVDELLSSLHQEGIGQSIAEIRQVADGAKALEYTASGLYETITNQTDSNIEVTRDTESYKKFAAVQQTSENFSKVYDDVQTRRNDLKAKIAETTQALQASKTDAETQKITAVLVAQSTELEAIDRELNFAAYQAILQDIENRNELGRQSQVTSENHTADKQDALQKLRTLVVPDDQATLRFGGSSR